MAASKVKKLDLGDEVLNRFRDIVTEALDRILGLPLLNSLLLVAQQDAQAHEIPLALTTAFQNIPHGLGRAPLGWVLVSPNADVRVWEDPTVAAPGVGNPDVTKFLRLQASAAVNCRILVF